MPGTPNYGLYIGTVGGDTGTWGGLVNTNVTTFLDSFLGNVLGVSITVADVTLTLSQWQNNGTFKLTGALTGNRNLILPFNGSTGAGNAVGGKFVVDNQCTGNFTVTVKTVAAGSVGVVAPQGARTSLYSDQTNVLYADDSRIAKLAPNAGNPNGSVTGFSGNPSTKQGADVLWDTTDQLLFVSAGSGAVNTSGTVWTVVGQNLPTPQGYLTPTTGVPIISSDSAGVTSIFYTPYKGNLVPIYNGTSFAVFSFAQLTLAFAAGSQLANGIYDVFIFLNGSTVAVAFGPSWLSGAVAGSVTGGSCARGTGAGSTDLTRINGILVNTNSITAANNGGSTFAIAANKGTYVGSVFVDATNGQVSNYLSYGGGAVGGTGGGPARRRGVWNAYNRVPLMLQCGDSFTSGSNTFFSQNTGNPAGTLAQLNAVLNPTSGNQIITFTGLAEEPADLWYLQNATNLNAPGPTIAIGINSTTAQSGFADGAAPITAQGPLSARHVLQPSLGINNVFPLVTSNVNNPQRFFTTIANCLLTARYMG